LDTRLGVSPTTGLDDMKKILALTGAPTPTLQSFGHSLYRLPSAEQRFPLYSATCTDLFATDIE
jgi:hypothetical protein